GDVDAVLGQLRRQAVRVVGQVDVVLTVVLAVRGGRSGSTDLDRLDLTGLGAVHELRVGPLIALGPALELLPREPEHEAQNDDKEKIEQAGPGDSAQMTGLLGVADFDTTTRLSVFPKKLTCQASAPAGAAASTSTAIPGTHASRPSAKTSGSWSRTCRGTPA